MWIMTNLATSQNGEGAHTHDPKNYFFHEVDSAIDEIHTISMESTSNWSHHETFVWVHKSHVSKNGFHLMFLTILRLKSLYKLNCFMLITIVWWSSHHKYRFHLWHCLKLVYQHSSWYIIWQCRVSSLSTFIEELDNIDIVQL